MDAAKKYRDLIDRAPTDILASSLWSAANTLRARHEAHNSAVEQARINDELPPLTATALQDLMQTHGIFFMGHPGAAEVERKMREYLNGPSNPEANKVADEIADTLTKAPLVLDPPSAQPLTFDQDAAKHQGPSAQMAEVSLQNRLQNIIGAIARKVWTASKYVAGAGTGGVIGTEVNAWLHGNQTLIAKFYELVTTQYPHWLDYIMQILSKLPM